MANVLLIGAAGLIGGILEEGLRDKHTIRGVDIRRTRGRGIRRADVRKAKVAQQALDGIDVVVDLAVAANMHASWRDVARENVPTVMTVLQAAQTHGISRYVFASSNHVTGMYENDSPYREIVEGRYGRLDPAAIQRLDSSTAIRPDSPYGVGKALGEAATRFYSDRFGLNAICLRIGTVNQENRPRNPRHFATLLTHRDLVQLVDCAIRAPRNLRFGTYYGVSRNTWRFWDIHEARDSIGYVPIDDAEQFRVGGHRDSV